MIRRDTRFEREAAALRRQADAARRIGEAAEAESLEALAAEAGAAARRLRETNPLDILAASGQIAGAADPDRPLDPELARALTAFGAAMLARRAARPGGSGS